MSDPSTSPLPEETLQEETLGEETLGEEPKPSRSYGSGWAKKYGLLLAIAFGLLIWFLPTPAGMNLTQHKLLALFAGAVVAWITQGINFAVSTFAIVTMLYFWVGNAAGTHKKGKLVHDANFAFSGFGTSSLWLLIGGFVISIAMTETGVAKRVALHLMKWFGKRPAGAVLSSMLANMVISPFTPSNTARAAAMLPICEGIADAYQADRAKESNFAKALFLGQTYATNITGSAWLTGTIPNPAALALIVAAVGASSKLTWSYWALASAPTNIIILLLTAFMVLRIFKPESNTIPGGAQYIRDELAAMGPMTLPEWKAIGAFAAALLLWSTDQFHGFNATLIAFVVGLFLFLPYVGVLDWKKSQHLLPWELFMYFGGVLTLSDVLTKTKAFEWLLNTIINGLGLRSLPMMPLLILLIGFTIFSHAIWSTTTAMMGVMIPIYIGMAKALHFDVVSFTLPLAIMMAYALFLPFNTMGNIIFFGAGRYRLGDQVKSSILVGLAIWALWIVTAFTWWKLIGLL